MSKSRRSLKRCAIVIGLLSAVAPPALSQEIGTAAAVNPAAQARGRGVARTIVIGHAIQHRERIQTTAAGSVQLLFLDKTSMTIGPNSDLAIDEYVYDPASNTGKLTASLGKGLLRFVGGQISHSGNARINTPNGVVGIRGGVGIIGPHHVFIGYGHGTVTSGSSSVVLSAGEYTETQQGQPPLNPSAPPPGWIARMLARFESQAGQTGGAPATVERFNQARERITGSSGGQVVNHSFPQGTNDNPPRPPQVVTTVNESVWQSVTTTVAENSAPPPVFVQAPPPVVTPSPVVTPAPDPAPPPAQQPQFTGPVFTLNMTNCCGPTGTASNAPYLPVSFATGSNSHVSQLMGYTPPPANTFNSFSLDHQHGPNAPSGGGPAPFLQWGIDITGSGASQSSWLMVATGELHDNGEGSVTLSGGFGATRRGAGNQLMGRASGSMSSVPGSITFNQQGVPVGGLVNQNDYVATTNHYREVQAEFFPSASSPTANYTFTQQATRVVPPTGLGEYRPGGVLTGWTGGLMRTVNGNGSPVSSSYATIGTAQLILDPVRSRVQASFDVVNASPNSLDTLLFANYQLGSTSGSNPPQSAYIDHDNFGAREAITVRQNGTTRQLSMVNGQRLASSTTMMVNVPRPVAQQILPSTTICDCEFTRWGFWSTDSRRTNLFGSARADQGHLLTWVAGQMPNAGEVPNVGTATYLGHVVANVRNGSSEYVAAGNVTNLVNFGTRSGTAQVTSFDGANYAGALAIDRHDPRYLGASLRSDVGNRTMLMSGNFYRGSKGPVGEMGGNVLVGGRNYLGSGIFAARAQ